VSQERSAERSEQLEQSASNRFGREAGAEIAMSARKQTKFNTGIVVSPKVSEQLEEIAFKAYTLAKKKEPLIADDISIAVLLAPSKAANAAANYVSEKAFETTLPDFRKLVAKKGKASLREAATNLLKKMPASGSPPFPQMRELVGEPEWRVLKPSHVRRALTEWIELMDQLSTMAGRGRSPITAETNFVSALAHYWTRELGATLGNSRAWANRPKEFEQKGLFAIFVREAGQIIPKEYRPSSWDHAIRRAIEASEKTRSKT